jgi:putative transposase
VRLHPTVAVATLAKDLKGSSSHLVTHEVAPGGFFKWQGSYGAFTLDEAGARRVESYVARQKQHHALGDLRDDWERTAVPSFDAAA